MMTGSDATTLVPLSDKLSLVTHHHLLTRVLVKLDLENWNCASLVYFFEQLCSGYEVSKYIHGFSVDASTSTPTPLTPKELKSMDTYFRKIKSIATILTSLGSPVNSQYVVTFALKGLPDKYDHVCGIMHHRETFTDLNTAFSMLTTEDMRSKSKANLYPWILLHHLLWFLWPNQELLITLLPLKLDLGGLVITLPMDTHIVCCMWLFRHKFLADDTLSRYKARLVTNGSTQLEEVDVDETFSLVVKQSTILTVLSLAASRYWPIHQLDVKNAFSHGMDTAYLLLYVDDIVLTASSETLLQQLIHSLHQEFFLTDLDFLNYFLGISVTRDSKGMFLSQCKCK
nr:putative reverse transcriptase [Tanacetum cinerariifolium]